MGRMMRRLMQTLSWTVLERNLQVAAVRPHRCRALAAERGAC